MWFVAPLVVSSVVPIMTLPFLTRALTPADYGAWALATALGMFAAGIATPGLQAGFERGYFSASDREDRARLLHSVVAFAALSLVVAGAVAWPWRADVANYFLGSPTFGSLLVLAFLQAAVTAVKSIYLLFYRGAGDARSYALYSIDEVLLGAALSMLLVIRFGMGAPGLVLGQLIAAASVLLLVAIRTALANRPRFALAPLLEAVRVGYPLAPRVFVGTLSSQIDKYVVGALQAVGAVGVYSLGQRLAFVPFTASNALEHMFVPRVYALMFERGRDAAEDIGRYLTPFAYMTAAVACVVSLFAAEIVSVLAPEEYALAAPVATVLAMSYALMFFGKLPQLVYAKKTWIASLLGSVTLVLNWGLCVVGVRWWGATGAAWGLLMTAIISGAIGFRVRQHYFPIAWEYRRLAAIFGLLLLAVATTLAMQSLAVPYAARLAVKVAHLAVLVWIGMRINVITRAHARLLWDLAARRAPANTL